MKISLDKSKCVASGQCVLSAPDVFDQDDDGIVMLLDEDPPEMEYENVKQAARVCPVGLITYSD